MLNNGYKLIQANILLTDSIKVLRKWLGSHQTRAVLGLSIFSNIHEVTLVTQVTPAAVLPVVLSCPFDRADHKFFFSIFESIGNVEYLLNGVKLC